MEALVLNLQNIEDYIQVMIHPVSAQQKELLCLPSSAEPSWILCICVYACEHVGAGFPKVPLKRVSICFLRLNNLLGDFLIWF